MRAILIGLMFVLFALPAWAGKLIYIEKIVSNGGELDVATFFQAKDNVSQKVGLLGIAAPNQHRISIGFSAADWHVLTTLWNKAVAVHSTSWQTIGTFNEVDTDDPSVLTISAGQGVQIVISSPARGAETFIISVADLDRFGAALQRTQTSLNNQMSE